MEEQKRVRKWLVRAVRKCRTENVGPAVKMHDQNPLATTGGALMTTSLTRATAVNKNCASLTRALFYARCLFIRNSTFSYYIKTTS